ncbi:MAG TPA: hypothetical protein VK835_08285 [Bacteroidia bacterium]|jgi:hypothetical protein|nr:hypothetical protein [Bacteroidia bacterium]
METANKAQLIDQYVSGIRSKLTQYTPSKINENDYDWAANQLKKAESQVRVLHPTSVIFVFVALSVFLYNQFLATTEIPISKALNLFIIISIGFYFNVQRLKLKVERLKTIMFLKQLK